MTTRGRLTQDSANRFRAWMARSGRTAAVIGAFVVGLWLTAREVITRRERSADDLPA